MLALPYYDDAFWKILIAHTVSTDFVEVKLVAAESMQMREYRSDGAPELT
tara:strand:- start:205 stop:354 length:150 start_codon:yes stop_codon:yes gene_type:complete